MKSKPAGMIVLDGMDGSGKGTQSARLQQAMLAAGLPTILTREPGGSIGAEEIRHLLVNGEPGKWDAMTELLLVYAARRSHLVDTVWPAIEAGNWVICDRFADSSRAFQGVAGELGLGVVESVHARVVGKFEPDLTLILDMDTAAALLRTRERGTGEDRFERKGERYHEKVRGAFRERALANPQSHALVDADQAMDAVTADIFALLEQRLGLNLI